MFFGVAAKPENGELDLLDGGLVSGENVGDEGGERREACLLGQNAADPQINLYGDEGPLPSPAAP